MKFIRYIGGYKFLILGYDLIYSKMHKLFLILVSK